MLEALAAGFEDPPGIMVSPDDAALLFFSDHSCLEDIVGPDGNAFKSNVHQLLNQNPFRPNVDPASPGPIYNHRCFRLREAPGNNPAKKKHVMSAGSAIFGRNATGGLAIQFTLATGAADIKYTDLNGWST